MGHLRRINKGRMVKLLFILAYSLVLLELTFQCFPAKYFQRQTMYRLYESDEYIPFRLRKNANAVHQTAEFKYHVETNDVGMRDRDTKYDRDSRRILALGDSFTFGHGVEWDEVYVHRLERRTGYDILNAGQASGYGTDTQYLYLKHKGLDFDPDIVLVGLFVFNDISEINSVSEWHDVKDGLPGRITTDKYYMVARKKSWKTPIENLARYSRILSVAMEKAAVLRYQNLSKEGAKAEIEHRFKDNFGFFRKEMSPEVQDSFEKWKRCVLGMKRLCDERGIRLIFAVFPMEIQIYPESFELYRSFGQSMTEEEMKANLPQKRILRFLNQHGIESIDLLPAFKGSEYTFDDVYYKLDRHWKPLGHSIVADEIARYLEGK